MSAVVDAIAVRSESSSGVTKCRCAPLVNLAPMSDASLCKAAGRSPRNCASASEVSASMNRVPGVWRPNGFNVPPTIRPASSSSGLQLVPELAIAYCIACEIVARAGIGAATSGRIGTGWSLMQPSRK